MSDLPPAETPPAPPVDPVETPPHVLLVDVVLPCLNEERAIVDVLRRLPAGIAASSSTTAPPTARPSSPERPARSS